MISIPASRDPFYSGAERDWLLAPSLSEGPDEQSHELLVYCGSGTRCHCSAIAVRVGNQLHIDR